MKKKMLFMLSLLRMIIAVIILAAYPDTSWVIMLIILAGATDILDGYLARRYQASSVVGGFIDGLSDKVLMLLLGVFFFFQKQVHWIFFVLFASRELYELACVFIAYVTRPASLAISHQSFFFGKITTVLQYSIIIALVFEQFALVYALIAIITITSVLAMIPYIKVYLR